MALFDLARTALFALPPEKAHGLSIQALKSGMVPTCRSDHDQRLKVRLGGLEFPNPVGLAAGYDKNAEVLDEILSLGFGFTEVGTITPRAQQGNPRPRVFRLIEDDGLINRLGFNNEGHAAARKRLQARKNRDGIVGVNIGANKDTKDFVADYEKGIDTFYDFATYFTANISSPNTPGLRNLQAGEALKVLLDRIFERVEANTARAGKTIPVFLKIAPDLEPGEMDEIARVVEASALSALIVSNTTLDRGGLKSRRHVRETGGLSGRPLFEKSTHVLAEMYARIGRKLPLIGVGGISSTEQAVAKIEAGASLVQLYTGMVYKGPGLPGEIVRGLSTHLDKTGLAHISEMVGSKADNWTV